MLRYLLPLLAVVAPLRADDQALLREVAGKWADERNHWAFTQLVREYDGGSLVEERQERFNPTRGETRRWELVEVNGRPPSAEKEAAFNKKKNKPQRREAKALGEYLDLDHARLVKEDARSVSYEIPLRRVASWLFPTDKVGLSITIDKQSRAIERGRVEVDGPFNVALGLARIVDLDFDLALPPTEPPSGEAHGTAYAVVNKLGRRIEYVWMDFNRVTPSAQNTPR